MDILMTSAAKNSGIGRNIILVIIVVMLLFYTLFPLYWLFLASLKTRIDLFTIPPKFLFTPTFEHFKKLFIYTTLETGEEQQTKFVFWLVNSALEAGIGTLLAVVLGTMAGYINSRMEYRGRRISCFSFCRQECFLPWR